MAENYVIKLITDNYDIAKEWYRTLMENGEIPGIGKVHLPKNHEDKVNAIALLIISSLEVIRTGDATIELPTEETMVAVHVFESLMNADLRQDKRTSL